MTQNQNDSVKNQSAAQKPGGKKKQHRQNKGLKSPVNNKQPQKTNSDEKRNVTSLQDLRSLVRMAPKSAMKPKHSIRAPLPNLMSYKGDGIDHINISTAAKTDLGKLLCSSSYLRFDHPILGKFNSIMAFNFYLTSAERDDRMRVASPKELRMLADAGAKIPVLNLWTLVCYATWVQINSYKAVVAAIRENTLPFDLYKQRNFDGKPASLMRPELHDVFLEIINAVSKAIKTGEPLMFRGSNLDKMIKLTEEFSAIGQPKVQEEAPAQKNVTVALLEGVDKKSLSEDIDRIHEQIVDPTVTGHANIEASVIGQAEIHMFPTRDEFPKEPVENDVYVALDNRVTYRYINGGFFELQQTPGSETNKPSKPVSVVYLMTEDGINWVNQTLGGLVEALEDYEYQGAQIAINNRTYSVCSQYNKFHGISSGDDATQYLGAKRFMVEKAPSAPIDKLAIIDGVFINDGVWVAIKDTETGSIYVAHQEKISDDIGTAENLYNGTVANVEIGGTIRSDAE